MSVDRPFVAVVAVFAFALAHAVVASADVPVVLYDPLELRWSFGHHAPGLMGYYGEALWAVCAAIVAGGLAAVRGRASTGTFRVAAILATIAIAADFVTIALVSARGT